MPGIRTGRKGPKVQACPQRPIPFGVELARGARQRGVECTILAHICTGTNAISIQNKRHLHWKATEAITDMNNEAEFLASAHNLLLKNGPSHINHHAYKHIMASIYASPQVAKKKRYVKLDLGSAKPNPKAGANPFQVAQEAERNNLQISARAQGCYQGSIGLTTALAIPEHV
jgi:hypothetical protein